jgi:hypothetical protein
MNEVEVSAQINADATKLYGLVSDLTRMGEWSPENTGGRWVGGATGPEVGAKFRGNNKHGFRRWSTTVRVTDATPGKRFAFDVTYGPIDIARWSYDFETVDGGTLVTERWVEGRPSWMKTVSKPVMGVMDRAAHNRRNMEATLAALKSAAEG